MCAGNEGSDELWYLNENSKLPRSLHFPIPKHLLCWNIFLFSTWETDSLKIGLGKAKLFEEGRREGSL